MDKQNLERIFRAAGMRPETRTNIDGTEVFIGDGFSLPPHINYRRFGVDEDEFPYGMYVTFWFATKGEGKLDAGQPLFFDALKSDSRNQHARINTAMKEAAIFLKRRKKARLDG